MNCRTAGGQLERRAPRMRPARQSEHQPGSVNDHSSEFYTPLALNQAVPAHRFVVSKTDSALRNICRLLSSRIIHCVIQVTYTYCTVRVPSGSYLRRYFQEVLRVSIPVTERDGVSAVMSASDIIQLVGGDVIHVYQTSGGEKANVGVLECAGKRREGGCP